MVASYNSKDVDGTITQGGYAQKVVVNENFVLNIPDSLDFDVAAPLLCAGITTYSAGSLEREGTRQGRDCGPWRFGPHGRPDCCSQGR